MSWSHRVRQNRKTDEEHDKGCVKEGSQLTRVKFDRDGDEKGKFEGSSKDGIVSISIL